MYEDTVFELSTKLLSNEITIDLYRNLPLLDPLGSMDLAARSPDPQDP
jgi:hypothetical protein